LSYQVPYAKHRYHNKSSGPIRRRRSSAGDQAGALSRRHLRHALRDYFPGSQGSRCLTRHSARAALAAILGRLGEAWFGRRCQRGDCCAIQEPFGPISASAATLSRITTLMLPCSWERTSSRTRGSATMCRWRNLARCPACAAIFSTGTRVWFIEPDFPHRSPVLATPRDGPPGRTVRRWAFGGGPSLSTSLRQSVSPRCRRDSGADAEDGGISRRARRLVGMPFPTA